MTAITKKIENVTEIPVTVGGQMSTLIIKHVRDPSKATFQIIVRATTKQFNPLNEEENKAVIKRIGDELETVVKKALEDRFKDLQAIEGNDEAQLEIGFRDEMETAHVEYDVKDEDEGNEETIIGDPERAAKRSKGERKRG